MDTLDLMDATMKNVEEIKLMVQDLTKISSKQNILALNASIEAARAGDAGRGFNIVAGEMGKLSTTAAEKYTEIIAKAEEIDTALKKMNRTIQYIYLIKTRRMWVFIDLRAILKLFSLFRFAFFLFVIK